MQRQSSKKKPEKIQPCWDLTPDLYETTEAFSLTEPASHLGAGH